MHERVHSPVEEAVLLLEGGYVEGAGGVVYPAAPVRRTEPSQLVVLGGRVPLAAPLGAGHPHHVQQVPLPPANLHADDRACHAVCWTEDSTRCLSSELRVCEHRLHYFVIRWKHSIQVRMRCP